MISDFLEEVLKLLQSNSNLLSFIVVFSTALFLYFDYRSDRRARREEQRKQDNLGLERRRLTEVNIKLQHELRVTSPREVEDSTVDITRGDAASYKGENPFAVFHLPLHNIGDGPVDILGMLVSGRVLSTIAAPTVGRRSRDVQWNDYQQSYWDDEQCDGLFCGISTTKHLVSSRDYFVRLAANEEIALRRIDAVNNVSLLRQTLGRYGEINLMYRAFLVARGYPLGEILRQLGGGPPDPLLNLKKELLEFQTLAQPNYFRWRELQLALLNLNQFAFRLAVSSEKEHDPLGKIALPDAWRFFLLHHWEFASGIAGAPERLQKMRKERQMNAGAESFVPSLAIENAMAYLKENEQYPDLQLPDNWKQDDEQRRKFVRVRDHCRGMLAPMVESWERLRETIERSQRYATERYSSNEFQRNREAPQHCPDEGYPRRIHMDADYYERWFALLREGYMISRPFPPTRKGLRFMKAVRYRDSVPDDPRVLEAFVMRTHYFLVPIHPEHERTTQTGFPIDGARQYQPIHGTTAGNR
jgi:hypothetical protein